MQRPTGTTALRLGDRLLVLGAQEACRTLFRKYVHREEEPAEMLLVG